LYLGEINDSQREGWIRSIEVFDEDARCQKKLQLFAPERTISPKEADAVQVRLSEVERAGAFSLGCACISKLA